MKIKEDLPKQEEEPSSSLTAEEEKEILENFIKKLLKDSVGLDPDIAQAVNEEFWKLV